MANTKPLNLHLSIDADQTTEILGWLRQVVETSIAANLAGLKQEQVQQPPLEKADDPRPSCEASPRKVDLPDAAKAKAGDLRIDLLLGKIPEATGILIDTATTAKLLGISSRTLYRLNDEKATPEPVRIGGKIIRWRLAELLEWIEAGCPPRKFWNYKGLGASHKRAGR